MDLNEIINAIGMLGGMGEEGTHQGLTGVPAADNMMDMLQNKYLGQMGQMGMDMLSGNEPLGGDPGGGVSQALPAVMQAAQGLGSSGQQSPSLVQNMIKALQDDPLGNSWIGPQDDAGTMNSVTMDSNGMTFKMPRPGGAGGYQGIQAPLEAIESFFA